MPTIQKLDAYPRPPGADYFTGSTRTPVIDTGVDIDRLSKHGRVYVCADTVGEWAHLCGWLHPDKAQAQAEALAAAMSDLADLQDRFSRFEALREALANLGVSIGVSDEPAPAEKPAKAAAADDDDIAEFPHHKGSGWWLLSDGTTMRGNADEAFSAQAEIALEAEVELDV